MMKPILMLAASAALLAGCGETDQTLSSDNTSRGDTPAWQGANNAHVASGWMPGDEAGWNTQLRTRLQAQNEYVRIK